MSRFVFKFEAVLKHRQRLEQQLQIQVAQKCHHQQHLRQDLDGVVNSLAQLQTELRRRLVGRLDAQWLAAQQRYGQSIKHRAATLQAELAALDTDIAAVRQALVDAARQRKAVQTLRQRQQQQWAQQQRQRENREHDEAAARVGDQRSSEANSTL
jgi:flagellar FliJ protein